MEGGRGSRKRDNKIYFLRQPHSPSFLYGNGVGGTDQASHWKILRDATEGKNFLMFQFCSSSSCRNRRVSSEVKPVHWTGFFL